MKRLLAICLAALLVLGCLPVMNEAKAATYQTATVKGGWLRLRSAPSFDAQVLGSYFTGTELTVLGTSGAWYRVRSQEGVEGYMYGAYLTVSSLPTGQGGAAGGVPAYVTSQNGRGVRLRSGPGTAYSVMGLYNVGTPAKILSYGSEWHYISIGNQVGYMMAMYLTTSSKPVVTPTPKPEYSGYTAYVTSTNGKSVRLRAGAGTEYDVIANYDVGTKVTVLSYGKEWCYIRVGGNAGYMMTQFLTTTPIGNTVTDVVLNTYSPSVGTRLTATVVPSGATVSYQWIDDQGSLLSYASTFTVTEGQKGRRIAVQVTGYGSCTGSVTSTYTAAVGGGKTEPISRHYQLRGVTISETKPTVGDTLHASVRPNGASATYAWYSETGALLGTGSSYTVAASAVGSRIYCVATGSGNTSGSATSSYTEAVSAQAVSYKLQTVVLNNATPMVGDTLTGTAKPDGSTATYSWYREDGRQVSSERSYTVKDTDVGYRLYCMAIGTGNTTGATTSTYTAAVTGGSTQTQQQLKGKVTIPSGARSGAMITPTLDLNSTAVSYQWYQNGVLIYTGASLLLDDSMVGDDIRLVVQALPGSGYTGEVGSGYCYVQKSVNPGIMEI